MQGLRIKSMRGRGGFIRNILFENIEINDVSEEAIQVSMFYPYSTVKPINSVPPIFEEITIRNIWGSAHKQSCVLRGLADSPIKKLVLENIDIKAGEADIIEYVELL